MATIKMKMLRLSVFALLLVMSAMPVYGQSLSEFAQTCDDASGQCAHWETLAPNSCEEPAPEELVCSEDNQESPERGDDLPIFRNTTR